MRSALLTCAFAFTLLCSPISAFAQEEEHGPSGRDIVVAYNTGFRFSIAPGVLGF